MLQPGDEIQINDTHWFREDYLIQHSRLYQDIIEAYGDPPHYPKTCQTYCLALSQILTT